MKLTFLGTGGYHPNERRHTASLLLPELGLAFDAGTGIFRAAPRLQTDSLQIFLSHAHSDHVCGLPYLLFPMLQEQIQRVQIYGLPETLNAVKTHIFSQPLFPVMPNFEWCELNEHPVDVAASGRLRWTRLSHPGGSTGFRIDWPDRSIAYITDTTAPGHYADFIKDVTLLVHECYFPDEKEEWAHKTGHSAASAVARLAAEASVGRLMLVHVDPQSPLDDPVGLDQMRSIFPATDLAEDLDEITF